MPRTESCWTLWTFKGHRISKVWFKCHLARVARKQGQRMKRLIDIAGSLFGLLLLSPVMLVAAIAIHRHMGEPVLFVQERPGLRGRPFRMYKFSTMRDAYDRDGVPLADADRITGFGRFRSDEHTSELQSLLRNITA